MKHLKLCKKSLLLLVLSIFTLISCSSDDTNTTNETDTDFKILFDFDGSGAVIGNNTLSVVNRFNFSNLILTGLTYSIDTSNLTMQFIGIKVNREISIFTFPLSEALGNSNGTIQAEEVPVPDITEDETIKLSGYLSQDSFFFLVEDGTNLIYKEYLNNTLVNTVNVTATLNISPFGINGFAFFKDQKQIVIVQDESNATLDSINVINLNDFSLVKYPEVVNAALFNSFSNNNEAFLIFRENTQSGPKDILYNVMGDRITLVDEIISRGTAIGYNELTQEFEFVTRRDSRKVLGTINTEDGSLTETRFNGETGPIWSKLFFFSTN